LIIKAGSLPSDLQGHVYIVGPVGSVDSVDASGKPGQAIVDPTRDGTTLLYNGDGMIYRLDFDNLASGVQFSSRLVNTPSYYADLGTNKCQEYQGSDTTPDLRFKNYGITRLSGRLGLRNQLNTAFVPMKFPQEERERLLVTWDMGRPYEIDPKTLEAVTPVGWNDEWKSVTKLTTLPFQPQQPFPAIQSCAHPCFDPHSSGQVVMVNTGRSLSNLLSHLIPIAAIWRDIWGKKQPSADIPPLGTAVAEYHTTHQSLGVKLWHLLLLLLQFLRAIWEFFVGNFVDVIVWDGTGKFQKWEVRHNGQPIQIQQSTHQIGLTEDYIVIIDTAFKVSVEELLPYLKARKEQQLEAWVRNILDKPQLADNHIYIVRRRDLKPGVKRVAAQKVSIPYEAAHFLVDYKNPDGNITIHFSHVCAWDAGESISRFDFADADNSDVLQRLYGVLYSPTDVSRLGRWVVNGETGQIVDSQPDILIDLDLTWGPAIASYRNPSPYAPPEQLEDIYWGCLGAWEDLLFPHILDLYRDYQYREIDLPKLEKITQEGRGSNLLRLHIDRAQGGKLTIADAYTLPDGYYLTSPQFVPSSTQTGSTDGYVVGIVHYGDGTDPETNGNEIWIFDGRNLKAPICKLYHPLIEFGFTVHATWLQTAERRIASYKVPVKEDFQTLLAHQSQLVQDLFDKWVYPNLDSTDP
jgi:carotenoid cleavage dioxygenase-like enzyme